jgi:hypothetical protein
MSDRCLEPQMEGFREVLESRIKVIREAPEGVDGGRRRGVWKREWRSSKKCPEVRMEVVRDVPKGVDGGRCRGARRRRSRAFDR